MGSPLDWDDDLVQQRFLAQGKCLLELGGLPFCMRPLRCTEIIADYYECGYLEGIKIVVPMTRNRRMAKVNFCQPCLSTMVNATE